jgi:hypothetical protein
MNKTFTSASRIKTFAVMLALAGFNILAATANVRH